MTYKDFENCGLKKSLDLLSGKWKPLILHHLFLEDKIRFIELWRMMPRVSKKVLLEQLKNMEEDQLIRRIEIKSFPTQVYYSLHENTRALGPALQIMERWGSNRC
ncbi:helix-turn-helix domain-containing protein [Gramella sp. AN32]|uniref:Winged helix-turn-helix transcriptional regulator n=1 Tax=Christiangramia antarctica TaxID=2058158 RepID=A0ABW5X4Z2_9FLAO|nr:helix-turn-helix domain-containing protein [Gramella sp. AN32]MCM4157819.1 transcriptional regulator [Gramella sp. AN32]